MSATRNQFSLPGPASKKQFRIRTACAARLPRKLSGLLLLLLTLPAAVQAQYTYTTNNGTITITGYTGPGGAVTIPSTINGLPVTTIGYQAFYNLGSLTSVTIPNSVTSIGSYAFYACYSLISVTIGNSVTNIGNSAFSHCTSLTSVTIPNSVTSIGNNEFDTCISLTNVTIGNSVTNIGYAAFYVCPSLTSVTIPNSVTSIGDYAFASCTNLTGVYFQGNAPSVGLLVFSGDNKATVYYLPGTTGWNPQVQTSGANFGVRTNRFGFTITGTSSMVIVVEACTNLANPIWSPLQTNTLTGGSSYFSDPQWTNYPARFYRLWGPTFGGRPAVLWNPQVQTSDASFGVRTNRFGFTITGTSNLVIVVEACTNLANPVWIPLQTNTLTGDSSYFSDPQWTNYPARFYRLRWP